MDFAGFWKSLARWARTKEEKGKSQSNAFGNASEKMIGFSATEIIKY